MAWSETLFYNNKDNVMNCRNCRNLTLWFIVAQLVIPLSAQFAIYKDNIPFFDPNQTATDNSCRMAVPGPLDSPVKADRFVMYGDFRLIGYYGANVQLIKNEIPWSEYSLFRFRLRHGAKIKLETDIDLDVRMVTEPYLFFDPVYELKYHEVLFDTMNVEFNNFARTSSSIKIGRQDIRMGSGFLVKRGTPGDSSRSNFFDAIRWTIPIEYGSKLDLIIIDNHANSSAVIRSFNDRDIDLAEQDSFGVLAWVSDIQFDKTTLNGYIIYKMDRHRVKTTGYEGELYTLGIDWNYPINNSISINMEIMPQWGHKNGKAISALASRNQITFKEIETVNIRIRCGYDYLSGHNDPDRAFDRLWGRQSGIGCLYDFGLDRIDGRAYDSSNMHRIWLESRKKLPHNITVTGQVDGIFAARHTDMAGSNGLNPSGYLRGTQFMGVVKWEQFDWLSHSLVCELFLPGNYYTVDRNDPAFHARFVTLFQW